MAALLNVIHVVVDAKQNHIRGALLHYRKIKIPVGIIIIATQTQAQVPAHFCFINVFPFTTFYFLICFMVFHFYY